MRPWCNVAKCTSAVLDHLPEEHQNTFGTKLNNAYAMFQYDDAKRALDKIHHELMHLNPSAARSLEEGMAETLTVHQLDIPVKLRKTLSSTT